MLELGLVWQVERVIAVHLRVERGKSEHHRAGVLPNGKEG